MIFWVFLNHSELVKLLLRSNTFVRPTICAWDSLRSRTPFQWLYKNQRHPKVDLKNNIPKRQFFNNQLFFFFFNQTSSFAAVFYFIFSTSISIQDDFTVTIEVHFELQRFEELRARYPLEALMATDVWPNAVPWKHKTKRQRLWAKDLKHSFELFKFCAFRTGEKQI